MFLKEYSMNFAGNRCHGY